MRSSAPTLCLLSSLVSLVAPVAAQYSTDFESLTASATGTNMTTPGQGGWYLAAVTGSVDWNAYTYAGNSLSLPANPNGGNNFAVGISLTSGTNFARAQHALTLPAGNLIYVQYDLLCAYVGAGTPVNNIGSFSFQPSTTNSYVNHVFTVGPTAATFNANTVVVGPLQAPLPTVSITDPAFAGLATNVWHTLGVTIDMLNRTHVDFRVTNGVTNVTTIFVPTTPLPLPGQFNALPTDFRFFAGGADNLVAIDNVFITDATYTTYGAGCAGTMGLPTLSPAGREMPLVGTTFHVVLGNLPLSLAVMMTGFSNTLANGSQPLPLDMTPFGFPGCNLLADPLVTEFLIGAGNTATWAFGIPSGNAFVGLTLYNQGLSLDTGAPGATFTNGGQLVIGN